MGVSNILELLSGVALFLFGMTLMGDGLKKVAGNKLELVLYRLSSTPLKGILLGTGVTAVIQSSSATSVMVVGFVNSGMMKVRQAMGVIMGAIIGTSITGWVICLSSVGGSGASGALELLSTDTFTALMAVIGIVLRMFSKKPVHNHIGDIMLGFAVLMYGIGFMSDAVYPLRESEAFINAIGKSSNPILGILIGLAFTSIIQSASAAIGILQALAVTGAITFGVALPMTMGIAIGAAVPVLLSALGANANGKKTAITYLMVDTLGAVVTAILFYSLNAIFRFDFMNTPLTMVGIALLNSCFRIFIVTILAPFIPLMERLVNIFVKDEDDDISGEDMDRLEERFLEHPTLAIEQCRLVIQSMAERTQECLIDAISMYESFSEKKYRKVVKLEELIDKYEDKLGAYLVKVMVRPMSDKQSDTVGEYLHSLTDLERISDHALNIAESLKEKKDRKIMFSADGYDEMQVLIEAVKEASALGIKALVDDDVETAYKVEPLEQVVDDLSDELKAHHIERIRNGKCTYEHGFIFNDLLTDLERISDHCSNLAVAVIEAGEPAFDTHEYTGSIKEIRGEEYDSMYNEFGAKYAVK